jgi:hypothetical protein
MKINITLDQASIETAIKDYVVKNGIDSPVKEVKFTITRKGGTSVDAEVILGTDAVKPEANVPEDVQAPEEIAQEEPVEESKPTPKTKTTTKAASKVAAFEPTKPVVDEEDVPDHVKMKDTTPPFDADNTESVTSDQPKQGKSLFL